MKLITYLKAIILLTCAMTAFNLLFPASSGLKAEDSDPYAPYDDGVPEGYTIIEGDIMVPIMQTAGAFDDDFWPDGVVPYEFDSNVTAANQTLMLNAMAEWEAVANVQFVARSSQSDYIHIQNSTRNSSAVCRQRGEQIVNIHNWGTHFTMVHELGHALCLWHEQSRPDRDTYITIEEDNIADTCGDTGNEPCDYNFNIRYTADVYPPDEYDFDSVMHYNQCAFTICPRDCTSDPVNCCQNNLLSCRTITVNSDWATEWQNAIGQRNHLSRFDELTMSFLYPESNWVFVDQSYSGIIQRGTFLRPFRSFNDGVSDVPTGGTIIIQPGDYVSDGVLTKAMTLRAPLGNVVLSK
jgi:hypothetical protein